jgi:dihydroorotate dehydrogenase (NAD+) catalytic subunit
LFVKLSPNVEAIGKIAKSAEDAGADAITAVNTMGPGMLVDIKTGKPMIGFRVGGVSGAALRPIAVRCVYDIYESVKIPIIGTGGVSSGRDAIEMIMAGASAVGIGTAVYERIDVFKKVCNEMLDLMAELGYRDIKHMLGMAHEN